MDKQQAFNMIVQVVLTRATGTAQEIDSWKQALQVLQKLVEPPKEKVAKK